MKISDLPESPGRDLLMRLEYLDNQSGGAGLHENYRQARDSSAYYVVLLANYVAEDRGDINSVGATDFQSRGLLRWFARGIESLSTA